MSTKPHIVVTGAAGGIGAALATHFLSLDWTVTGMDLIPIDVRRPDFHPRQADVTDEDAMERIFDAAARTGPIRAVIVNAAVTDTAHHDTLRLPYRDWARVLRVNVDGAFLTARAGAQRMIPVGGGNIVFITSSLAFPDGAQTNDAPYCSSKAAVEMLARVMALELKTHGVNVNTLFPSAMIDTGFFAHWDRERRARALAPATLLNDAAAYLADLPPGGPTGRSIDQDRWDRDPAYRDSLEGIS